MRLIEILENRKEALKVAEVAKMLGVTPQHIYKMAKAGLIPCFHVKGAVRFCPAELAEWIKQEIEQANRKRNGSSGGNDMKYGT
jgi:excisionase family DNA binding protein